MGYRDSISSALSTSEGQEMRQEGITGMPTPLLGTGDGQGMARSEGYKYDNPSCSDMSQRMRRQRDKGGTRYQCGSGDVTGMPASLPGTDAV